MKQDVIKFKDLTEDQASAVTTTEGRVRVVAGAGSGKTRTLVARYSYLTVRLGVPQSDVLCLTFTNKAAQEMRKRITANSRNGAVGDFVTTIHGFCVKFLREEIYRLKYPQNYIILDEEDMKAVVKEILEENKIERKKGIVGNYLEELGMFKASTPYIQNFVLPTEAFNLPEIPVLGQMILRQRRYFALDFDDLLFFTLYILNNFPEVREKWTNQFQYVMIDEVQDCSKPEWELFTILSEHYGNLFIVGDSDQAIYEWKGAHPELLVDYNPETDIYLKENFRSLPNIVCLADCIIMNNRNRLPRTSVTKRPSKKFRTKFHHCRNERQEAEKLASQLKKIHVKESLKWSDMAVLYRASYLSRSIEQALMSEKVPYVIWGGVRFFERKEIKDALAYLRLLALDDDVSFKRIANVPSRKIGKKTMALLQGYASAKGCSLFVALRESGAASRNQAAAQFIKVVDEVREEIGRMSISAILDRIIDMSGLMEQYRIDTEEERLENLQELVKSVRLYEEDNKEEEDLSIVTYLQDIALYTNADYRKDDDKVKLMTVHQAKGLEFPLVWIYGLNEGVLPSHRTIRERGEAGLEEERRLMYVACTRAMDKLFFSDSEGFNVQNSLAKYPSRFIREAQDAKGPLYDIDGHFSPELWDGTDRLIANLEGPTDNTARFAYGARVKHPVFGNGTILETDSETGNVKVKFDEFGIRRMSADVLEQDGQ